jgi:hypothetical protein
MNNIVTKVTSRPGHTTRWWRLMKTMIPAVVQATRCSTWPKNRCIQTVRQSGFKTIVVEVRYNRVFPYMLSTICKLAAIQARKQGWKHIVIHRTSAGWSFSNRSIPAEMLAEDLPPLVTTSELAIAAFCLIEPKFETKNWDRDFYNIWEDERPRHYMTPKSLYGSDRFGLLEKTSSGIHPERRSFYEFRGDSDRGLLMRLNNPPRLDDVKINLFNKDIKSLGELY